MNSWRRTLNEFIRVCGREYVYGYRGKCIPEGYDSWECFLAKEENYKKSLPTYIIEFMDVVYTIGNFMPVLYGEKRINFNTRRPLYTRDYWDLTLLAIYNYYDEKYSKGEGEELQLKSLFKEKEIKEWLDKFVDWNGFVKENFMQPFVKKIDKDKGNYSAPHLKYIDFYAKRRK